MTNNSGTLDRWREYFRSSNSDIFIIIEHAIMVAASDCPCDFKMKRGRIAEMLFTCKQTKCFGCERIELVVPCEHEAEKSDEKYKSENEAGGSKDTKESTVHSNGHDHTEMNVNHVNNFGYGEAEALTDELEEESQLLGEVLRIKEILDNSEEESASLLFDSLRRLQLMALSVEILKAAEIGKSVSALRKHGSKEIRNLVKALVGDWTIMVDEWANATEAITGAEVAKESVKTSAFEEEEGLPSPPMDEGAFFATPTSMELSQFFDGMDDDGIGDVVLDPRNSGEFNENRANGRKPTLGKPSIPKWRDETPEFNKNRENGRSPILEKSSITKRKDQTPDSSTRPKDAKGEQRKDPEAVVKKQTPMCNPNKPPSHETGPGKLRPALQSKVKNEIKFLQKADKGMIQKKPMPPQQDKLRSNDEASVRVKLEAAKRKLHERYQEAENAKKQRTVQVVEFRDLPKQSLAQRNQHMRPGNHNRHWANGRR
ncbi:probable mediator of RNA polymerase II transcription subunit 26b [Olea europaea subsp. europaea]|uniref:Probable mediator of RNA polymerase II transcription subunit 26b n=1 Tax=Olea europaea subsp. europaea TaxID=158383 RepID=A0A8S0TS02_OLEEU|nr:probable mediator of RNA polymerase II transcription subunit 26b [Olea europaea subsp. europaea]